HHDWGKAIGKPLDKANVMDAFCGTGALAFEAISRGAVRATLFDKDRDALDAATGNAAKLGIQNLCQIVSADTLKPPKAAYECRMVFIAPPYRKGLIGPG